MDRQKKLIIVGAAALFLLIAIIVLVVLVINNSRNQPEPPEPTPIETIEPIATPTVTPDPTPEPTPEATPTEPGPPVLPGEDSTPAPEETPTATPTPTEAGSPNLPGSSSTPKPTATPKPSPAPAFDFTLPQTCAAGTPINISTTATGISSVEWVLIKKGDIEIEVSANGSSDVTGALAKAGGSIAFINTGSYTLKAVAKTTAGNTLTSARSIEVSATATPTPGGSTTNPPPTGGFAFGLPQTAYTDTVVTVSVTAGAGAVAWTVLKDGSEIALSEAFAGVLQDAGGMIVFKSEGTYTLMGKIAGGNSHSSSIAIRKRAS